VRYLLVALALASMGCAVSHRPTPRVEVRAVPLLVKDRVPLRAAVFVPEEQMNRRYRASFTTPGLDAFDFEFALGETLQNSLLLSFNQVFDRVTVARAQPAPGAYHLTLVPRIVDQRWELFGSAFANGARFVVSGALEVLDESGKRLIVANAEGRGSTGSGGPIALGNNTGPAISEALADMIRRWSEQILPSAELEGYVSRARPPGVQAVGSGGPPATSEITISFSHPAEKARLTDETITLVGLISAAKGVQRLDLVVNGLPVPVSRDVRVQSTGVQNHPFTAQIPLRPGENLIALTAVDTAGGAAQAVRTVFRDVAQAAGGVSAPRLGGERWAVVIGIDQYKDPSISSLRYATADAESVFRFLTTRGGVKPANARLLLNQQANQRAVREVLGDFLRQKALREDEVIIYYAGHGTTEADASAEGGIAKYLVPWDADPDKLFSSAIPMEEIDRVFGRLAARKILLVQDTCFSGGAGGRTFLAKGLTTRAATLTDKFLQELTQKEGRMILTASDVNQVSQEDPALGHGIFTHYLLEALNGAADLDGDGAITVREVHLYLQRKVHERSNGAQTPQLYNIGDMVLVQKQR
jgi:hypothetical protein